MLDKQNTMADQLSLVGAAGAQFTDAIYLGTKEVVPGRSTLKAQSKVHLSDIELLAQVTEDLDSAGDAATLKLEFGYADDDAGTNFVALRDSGALAQAVIVKGYGFPGVAGGLPPIPDDKYAICRLTSAVADPTAGKVTIGFVRARATNGL